MFSFCSLLPPSSSTFFFFFLLTKHKEFSFFPNHFLSLSGLTASSAACYLLIWRLPSYLALAEGALGAVFNPGGAAEAGDVVLVRARLGDVVADGVGLAGVGDTAGTALAFGHHGKLTVHKRARQGPAVHLPLLWSRWERQFETERRTRKAGTVQNHPCSFLKAI